MRVISGVYRSRQLRTLAGTRTRPTTGIVREAVFNTLQARTGGSVWLDLYAGSGGIGIEALSRGAEFCFFVDINRQACHVIRANLKSLDIRRDKATLLCLDAESACRIISSGKGRIIEIAYLDPPYCETCEYVKAINSVETVLASGGIVVIEHHKDYQPSVPYAEWVKTKTYGLSAVSFFQKGDF